MTTEFNTVDKAATALGGGLMLLGIVVLGIVELLDGAPYGAAPVMNDVGEVVASPLVDPNIRTGLVILGLVVLFLWGLYRLALPETVEERTPVSETLAD